MYGWGIRSWNTPSVGENPSFLPKIPKNGCLTNHNGWSIEFPEAFPGFSRLDFMALWRWLCWIQTNFQYEGLIKNLQSKRASEKCKCGALLGWKRMVDWFKAISLISYSNLSQLSMWPIIFYHIFERFFSLFILFHKWSPHKNESLNRLLKLLKIEISSFSQKDSSFLKGQLRLLWYAKVTENSRTNICNC